VPFRAVPLSAQFFFVLLPTPVPVRGSRSTLPFHLHFCLNPRPTHAPLRLSPSPHRSGLQPCISSTSTGGCGIPPACPPPCPLAATSYPALLQRPIPPCCNVLSGRNLHWSSSHICGTSAGPGTLQWFPWPLSELPLQENPWFTLRAFPPSSSSCPRHETTKPVILGTRFAVVKPSYKHASIIVWPLARSASTPALTHVLPGTTPPSTQTSTTFANATEACLFARRVPKQETPRFSSPSSLVQSVSPYSRFISQLPRTVGFPVRSFHQPVSPYGRFISRLPHTLGLPVRSFHQPASSHARSPRTVVSSASYFVRSFHPPASSYARFPCTVVHPPATSYGRFVTQPLTVGSPDVDQVPRYVRHVSFHPSKPISHTAASLYVHLTSLQSHPLPQVLLGPPLPSGPPINPTLYSTQLPSKIPVKPSTLLVSSM
jgi:hypothetical protein